MSATSRNNGYTGIILAFFILSGMTGLMYEILWTRLITEIIGTAPYAVSIVLTVFMGGLGLGAFYGGRASDRINEPGKLVMLYGILETAVGLMAVALPWIIALSTPIFAMLYNTLYHLGYPYHIVVFIGCVLILLPPVLCMGATLPVLSRYYITGIDDSGARLGRLYGINTAGAAAGALVAGFWMINLLGMKASQGLAIAITLSVGTASIILGRSIGTSTMRGGITTPTVFPLDDQPPVTGITALVVVAVSGFCSMSWEVIWTRLLALIVGPTTYSFTIVLVTFITGLALGSIVFGKLADKMDKPLIPLLFTQAAAVVSAIAVSQIIGTSQIFFAKLIYHFSGSFLMTSFWKAAALFVFMFTPTFFLGGAFPLACATIMRQRGNIGRSVGTVYAVNTAGSVLGSFAAGFVLIPFLGKADSVTTIAVIQIAVTLIAATVLYVRLAEERNALRTVMIASLAGLVLAVPYPRWDNAMLSVGKYHRMYDIPDRLGWFQALTLGNQLFRDTTHGDIVYEDDGIGGFTVVRRKTLIDGSPEFSLFNSGKSDASTSGGDMCTQTLLAHFPMLFHPSPDNVLVIGLASGITAGEILHYPVKRLDVVDINDRTVAASDFFRPWNNNVLDDPRTHLIIQDGRAHMRMSDTAYDVIISEPSNPWMAGLAALFTRDCFELARKRLDDNGVFVQWLHAYQIDWENFAMIGRTFADVFPNSIIASTGNGADYLMIGYKGGNGPDRAIAMNNLGYAALSKNVSITDPDVLLGLVVDAPLAELVGDGAVNTDNRPYLEYAAPKLMNHVDHEITKRLEISAPGEMGIGKSDESLLKRIAFAEYFLAFDGLHVKYPETGAIIPETDAERLRYGDALTEYARRWYIPDFSFIVNDTVRTAAMRAQLEGFSGRVKTSPVPNLLRRRMGRLAYDLDDYDRAEQLYTDMLTENEDAKLANYNLGIIAATRGNYENAVLFFEKETAINPTYLDAYNSLGNALFLTGRTDEAIACYSRALDIDQDYIKAHRNLGSILKKTGHPEEGEAHIQEAERLTRREEALVK